MSTGDDSSSNGLATSTRTPSLTDSLYNIQVVKVRQDHDNQTRSIQKTKCPDISEDPFVDQVRDQSSALSTLADFYIRPLDAALLSVNRRVEALQI